MDEMQQEGRLQEMVELKNASKGRPVSGSLLIGRQYWGGS